MWQGGLDVVRVQVDTCHVINMTLNVNPGTIKSSTPSLSRPGGSAGGEANDQSVMECVMTLLNTAKAFPGQFHPIAHALLSMFMLVQHYEVRVEWVTAAHSLCERPQQFKDVREKAANFAPQVD